MPSCHSLRRVVVLLLVTACSRPASAPAGEPAISADKSASQALALVPPPADAKPAHAPAGLSNAGALVVAPPPGPNGPPTPIALTDGDGSGLRLHVLRARVVLHGPLAFTELQLTFNNPENRRREGQFAITLPPTAAVSRFAMKNAGGWMEGEVVEKQQARRIYEDFLHRRQDPALLEQDAGNTFRARVFPIEANADKELIVSWSQELVDPQTAYALPLLGLPKLQELSIRAYVPADGAGGQPAGSLGATVGRTQVVSVDKSDFQPGLDFELWPEYGHKRMDALRSGRVALARITPPGGTAPEGFERLIVLFDTSASQALAFELALQRLGDVVQLAGQHGAREVVVLAFDQQVEEIFRGTAKDFGAAGLQRLRLRAPLGASDLGRALAAAGAVAQDGKGGKSAVRVVLIGDGVSTAGAREPDALRERVRALQAAGVQRLDAVTTTPARDEPSLQVLVTAGLAHAGAVLDGRHGAAGLADLTRATFKSIEVQVPGATWVWPDRIEGLQAGRQVLVYADLPEDKPFEVRLTGGVSATLQPDAVPAPRPLLERAWISARIQMLLFRSTRGDPDLRSALLQQAIKLSVEHRVLCAQTALLVLETEQDYARYHLDRKALADILTVGAEGVVVQARRPEAFTALAPQPAGAQVPETEAPAGSKGEATGAPLRLREAMDSNGKDDDAKPVAAAPPPPAPVARPAEAEPEDGEFPEEKKEADKQGAVAAEPSRQGQASAPAADRARAAVQGNGIAGALGVGTPSTRLFSGEGLGGGGGGAPPSRNFQQLQERAPRAEVARRRSSLGSIGLRDAFQAGVGQAEDEVGLAAVLKQMRDNPALTGRFQAIEHKRAHGSAKAALAEAWAWRRDQPTDVLALVALGHTLREAGDLPQAARAYGSLLDLYPGRADLRRFAGNLLDRLGDSGLELAIDSYRAALAQRPDHPSVYHMLALDLARAGRHLEALDVLGQGLRAAHREGVFNQVDRILKEDMGLIAAAWLARHPEQRAVIAARLQNEGAQIADQPDLRFVLTWETDANDVDFHIFDRDNNHAFYQAQHLASGGDLYADITTGYGPECFAITKPNAAPYRLFANYYSRGPMGWGMGRVQVIRSDGKGGLSVDERPFVIMADQAWVDLGTVAGR